MKPNPLARPRYTAAEVALLRRHYPSGTQAAILAALPARTWGSIQNAASIYRVNRNVFWSPAQVALLRTHYAALGGQGCAPLVDKPANAVTKKALKLGLARDYALTAPAVREAQLQRERAAWALAHPPKAPKAAKEPKRKAERVARPARPEVKLLPTKPPRITLPNLNAAKSARMRAEEAPRKAAIITAEQVKKMPYTHPARMAYMLDGVRGWQAWEQSQQPR